MATNLLRSLFMECRPALLRFLRARGAAAEEAEDLIQDLYLKLDSQPIGAVAEPRAYLYRMADNLMLDRRRASQRRDRREEAWSDIDGAGARPATDDALISQEQLRLVTAALATLPERTVEIFRRFRIEGERQKAIAANFDISVSAVEKHLQRAYEVVLAFKVRDAENHGPRRHIGESESDEH